VTNVVGVACGHSYTALVKSDGTAWSFGKNDSGQLGLGNNTPYNTPQQILGVPNVVGVACGYYHTVLIDRTGQAWSFGGNYRSQLGLGNNTDQNTPQQIQGVPNVVGVACGSSHTVLVDGNEQVWSFGGNYRNVPTQIPNFILPVQPIPIRAQAALMFAAEELAERPGTVAQLPQEILRVIAQQDGGNGEYYRKKYIKYKAKYLQLKNN
jgi:hypothetical protein